MSRRFPFFLLVLILGGLLFSAYQWRWEDSQAAAGAKTSTNKKNPPVLEPAKQVKPVKPSAPAKSKPESKPKQDSKPKLAVPAQPAATSLPKPPAATPRPFVENTNMLQVQQKINDVLRLNEKLAKLSRVRTVQVQTMVDQARVHQRLLSELSSPADVAGGIKTSDADKVLMHQKLRALREESEKPH